MSLPLRITFEGTDYIYTVITRSITKHTRSIRLSLQGQEYEIIPNERGEWNAADSTVFDDPALLKAIARNVALRYRL